MNAVILSCGTELITGQTVDTNSAWIAERLTAFGVGVLAHVSVGDDVQRIAGAIRQACADADLVLITGGLGPTRDDLTRDAVALALNRPLNDNPEALAQIEGFFHRWQRDMPESNKIQAQVPLGCEAIPNARGTAPGIACLDSARGEELNGVIALPGVPGEMKPMFESYVVPRLTRAAGGSCTLTARLHCFGISEARLGETIADLMARGRNPLVGTTASQALLSIRILAKGPDAGTARKWLDADRAEIRRRLGPVVYGEGEDTLQSALADLLLEQKKTVVTAESCTGGMLAKMLTDVPGSSAYFLRGYVVYSNEAKTDLLGVPPDAIERHGAVSEPVARWLAESARGRGSADYALSLTGIAGPGGGSAEKPVGLVYIGLAGHGGTDVHRVLLGEHLIREEIRDRACKTALNMLRLHLLA